MKNERINVYTTLFFAYVGARELYKKGIIDKDEADLYEKVDDLGLKIDPIKWENLDNALNAILEYDIEDIPSYQRPARYFQDAHSAEQARIDSIIENSKRTTQMNSTVDDALEYLIKMLGE